MGVQYGERRRGPLAPTCGKDHMEPNHEAQQPQPGMPEAAPQEPQGGAPLQEGVAPQPSMPDQGVAPGQEVAGGADQPTGDVPDMGEQIATYQQQMQQYEQELERTRQDSQAMQQLRQAWSQHQQQQQMNQQWNQVVNEANRYDTDEERNQFLQRAFTSMMSQVNQQTQQQVAETEQKYAQREYERALTGYPDHLVQLWNLPEGSAEQIRRGHDGNAMTAIAEGIRWQQQQREQQQQQMQQLGQTVEQLQAATTRDQIRGQGVTQLAGAGTSSFAGGTPERQTFDPTTATERFAQLAQLKQQVG